MIESFGDFETEMLFRGEPVMRYPAALQNKAFNLLQRIDAAESLFFLKNPPSNRLEKLKGNRRDFYSVRVNNRWRIVFQWKNGRAVNVEFIDYH